MEEIAVKVLNVEMAINDGRPLRALVDVQIGPMKIMKFRVYGYESVDHKSLYRVTPPRYKSENAKVPNGLEWKPYIFFTDKSLWLTVEGAILTAYENKRPK